MTCASRTDVARTVEDLFVYHGNRWSSDDDG